MRLHFKPDDTLVICPETSTEAMALKYWQREYDEQGDKLLEVDTDVPVRLPAPDSD